MFYNLTKILRQKFHPLHYLRKNQLFTKVIMPFLDISIAWHIYGVKWKVYMKLVKNLSWILNSRILEPEITTLFLAINKVLKPKCFWDVGANIGFYTWLLLSHNSELEAVLFEPDRCNVELIKKTIKKAKIKKASLIDSAVSDKTGRAKFAIDNLSSATGTLEISEQTFVQHHYKCNQDLLMVETITLDQCVNKLKMTPPDFIKIDVEGSEKKVLDGGMELIKYYQPIVIFECFSTCKNELTSRLTQLNYTIYDAENINGSVEEATNLLALPLHHLHLVEEILYFWQKELEIW